MRCKKIFRHAATITMLLCIAFSAGRAQSNTPVAAPKPVAETGVEVPPPDFLAKYDQMMALMAVANEQRAALKVIDNKIGQMNSELVESLRTEHAGKAFNGQTRVFYIPPPEPPKASSVKEPAKEKP